MAILITAFSGLLAASAMVVLFEALVAARLVPADIMGTIGRKVLPTLKIQGEGKQLAVGAHLLIGMLFAFVYVMVWKYIGFSSVGELVTAGAITGLGHGIVVSLFMVNFLSEPFDSGEKIAVFGFSIGLLEVLAHILYGAVLGLAVGSFQIL